MSTKRQAIDSIRTKLNERTADSNYSNQFLYNSLIEQAKWLIKREISAGRIYSNTSLFQTLTSVEVIETSTIDECSPIKNNCKIYRTKNKLPDIWIDNSGPVARAVTSVDGSTRFLLTTANNWQNKKNDPYQRLSTAKYCFFANGYLWFPEHNPHYVNIDAFFIDDVSLIEDMCDGCNDKKKCVRFLDTRFIVPDWTEAEMYAKAIEQIAGVTDKIQPDQQIDKNTNRKN